ncbi:SDR family NAD(P)-dependent oxidoreductase, partial [Vibrio parahaemolyticus]
MRDSQPGSIINISSVAGLVAVADYPAYNASKAAVWLLSKSIALYCAQQKLNIRCNSVHPAYIRTAIIEPIFQALGADEAERRL